MKAHRFWSVDDPATLQAIRWLSITHALAMVVFAALVGAFLWYARQTGLEPAGDGKLEEPMQIAVLVLSALMLMTLYLLGRNRHERMAAEIARDRLFTLSPDPLCVMRPDGRLIRGNPAFESFFAPGDGNAHIVDRAHPDDRDKIARIIEAVSREGAQGVSFEARFTPAPRTPDDSAQGAGWRWLQWSLSRDPQSAPPLLYAIARDTTQRREAEAALAAETAFRQAMEDSMVTGMRALDLEGRITYVNRAFCEMVGLKASDLVGKLPPFPYWPADHHELHRSTLERVLAGGITRGSVENRIVRSDGTLIDTKIYVSRLVDREGRHTGWMTSINDITEPRRIRAALAAAHERFTTVLEALEAAVSVVGLDEGATHAAPGGGLLFVNRMYREWFNDTGESHRALRRSQLESGAGECFHPALNRWFELRARAIRWVDGSLVEILVATDVTARREADEKLRREEQKLQQSARLVTMGEMASSLAHELNQPLTAIVNYCSGLRARIRSGVSQGRAIDPTMLLEMLDKTAAQAERAGEVIRRIRNFVKRSEPERQECPIGDVLDEALGLAQIDAKRHRVRILTQLPADLPRVYVDRILIQQVLMNLLKNAIEASREATAAQRTVTIAVEALDANLQCSVTDQGPGIRDEASERLYESFFSTKPEGMGIGLNICRSIVEAHQGRLWHESPDSGGTRFLFTLPIVANQALADAA